MFSDLGTVISSAQRPGDLEFFLSNCNYSCEKGDGLVIVSIACFIWHCHSFHKRKNTTYSECRKYVKFLSKLVPFNTDILKVGSLFVKSWYSDVPLTAGYY